MKTFCSTTYNLINNFIPLMNYFKGIEVHFDVFIQEFLVLLILYEIIPLYNFFHKMN